MNKLEKITYLVFIVLILIFMIILHNLVKKSIKLSEEILKYNQPEMIRVIDDSEPYENKGRVQRVPEAIRLIDDSEYYKDTKKLTEIVDDKDIIKEDFQCLL